MAEQPREEAEEPRHTETPPKGTQTKAERPRHPEPTMAEESRATQPRSEQRIREIRAYWQRLDDLFYRTVRNAERAFIINVSINVLLVIVGIIVLAYSIVYSWTNGLDLYSTAFGSIGIIEFITVFYLTPQRKIQKTVGDLAQTQMFYRTYFMEAEAFNDWDYYTAKTKTLEQLIKMNEHLKDITIALAEKIEELVGKKD